MKAHLLFLVLLASSVFAASGDVSTQCQTGCCEQYGGTWSGGYCSGASSSSDYSTCSQTCEQIAGGTLSCCGPSALLLAVLGGAAFVRRRR
jgi:MYXO-CTERM domain-containing protein